MLPMAGLHTYANLALALALALGFCGFIGWVGLAPDKAYP
jgi:hypothetical protein